LQQNLLSIRQQLAMRNLFAAEQHATQLGRGILECEIHVAGRLRAQVGDLACHPDLADRFFQQPFDLRREFRDGQNLSSRTAGFRREQLPEVPL
jgi:hypothetical protein